MRQCITYRSKVASVLEEQTRLRQEEQAEIQADLAELGMASQLMTDHPELRLESGVDGVDTPTGGIIATVTASGVESLFTSLYHSEAAAGMVPGLGGMTSTSPVIPSFPLTSDPAGILPAASTAVYVASVPIHPTPTHSTPSYTHYAPISTAPSTAIGIPALKTATSSTGHTMLNLGARPLPTVVTTPTSVFKSATPSVSAQRHTAAAVVGSDFQPRPPSLGASATLPSRPNPAVGTKRGSSVAFLVQTDTIPKKVRTSQQQQSSQFSSTAASMSVDMDAFAGTPPFTLMGMSALAGASTSTTGPPSSQVPLPQPSALQQPIPPRAAYTGYTAPVLSVASGSYVTPSSIAPTAAVTRPSPVISPDIAPVRVTSLAASMPTTTTAHVMPASVFGAKPHASIVVKPEAASVVLPAGHAPEGEPVGMAPATNLVNTPHGSALDIPAAVPGAHLAPAEPATANTLLLPSQPQLQQATQQVMKPEPPLCELLES